MKELVEFIARSLVDDPDEVRVIERARGSLTTLELRVAEGDMGRVIGRNGRVANAIRALVNVAADRQGKRVELQIG